VIQDPTLKHLSSNVTIRWKVKYRSSTLFSLAQLKPQKNRLARNSCSNGAPWNLLVDWSALERCRVFVLFTNWVVLLWLRCEYHNRAVHTAISTLTGYCRFVLRWTSAQFNQATENSSQHGPWIPPKRSRVQAGLSFLGSSSERSNLIKTAFKCLFDWLDRTFIGQNQRNTSSTQLQLTTLDFKNFCWSALEMIFLIKSDDPVLHQTETATNTLRRRVRTAPREHPCGQYWSKQTTIRWNHKTSKDRESYLCRCRRGIQISALTRSQFSIPYRLMTF
jgi:hypothetical protein